MLNLSMHTLQALQNKVQKAFESFVLPNSPSELYDPINYLLNLSGKRIRPCLVLMGANLFCNELDGFMDQAMAIEVFHNFTLMHDDIMDQAPIRRGKPTVHERWNVPIAILSGDAMLVEAYKLLLNTPIEKLKPVLALFNQTATEVCEGQQMDMNFETGSLVSISDYLEMISLKTAVLLGASMKIGALLGGASSQDTDHSYEFGKNLGIAFQLQDDFLDIYAEPEKFGKQIGGDILAGKKTFLLLTALSVAQGENLKELKFWLEKTDAEPQIKIESVKQIFNGLNIPFLVEEKIKIYHDLATLHLDKISVPAYRKEVLEELTDLLLNRQH